MTGIYRPVYTRGGKRRKSRFWHVAARIAGRRRRVSTGCSDRRAAEEKARAIVARWEREAVGLVTPADDHAVRPIEEHLKAFQAVLNARGRVERYVEDRVGCIQAFLDASGTSTVGHLDAGAAATWIGELQAKGLAAATLNRRIRALYQFGRWLVRAGRAARNPFASLTIRNEAIDRRHVRRALRPEELDRLIRAPALRLRRFKNVGAALQEKAALRSLIYQLAAGTGLRRGELRRLRWADVDEQRRWLRVSAASAKARKEQGVPLRTDLLSGLLAIRPEKFVPTSPILPERAMPGMRSFRADLKAAGIPYEDPTGAVVDFHSLRLTFVTALAAAGVHPRVAQALARHSSIELTMRVYTDVDLLDLRSAVEATRACAKVRQMGDGTLRSGAEIRGSTTSAESDAHSTGDAHNQAPKPGPSA